MSRFGVELSDFREHQCKRCVHFQGGGKCAAFPSGIPSEIRLRERDHRQPYPGDHGIRFEALQGKRHPLEVIGDDGV